MFMKRHFDIHDQRTIEALTIEDGSTASHTPAETFGDYFRGKDVRELTLIQYRRLSELYTGGN